MGHQLLSSSVSADILRIVCWCVINFVLPTSASGAGLYYLQELTYSHSEQRDHQYICNESCKNWSIQLELTLLNKFLLKTCSEQQDPRQSHPVCDTTSAMPTNQFSPWDRGDLRACTNAVSLPTAASVSGGAIEVPYSQTRLTSASVNNSSGRNHRDDAHLELPLSGCYEDLRIHGHSTGKLNSMVSIV